MQFKNIIKIFSICLLVFSTSCFSASKNTDSYLCAKYYKQSVNKKNIDKNTIIDVGIFRMYSKSVEIYVLGFGRSIRAHFNDHFLPSTHIVKRRTLKCNGINVGQTRTYDLSQFEEKYGKFSVSSGDKTVSTYIDITD